MTAGLSGACLDIGGGTSRLGHYTFGRKDLNLGVKLVRKIKFISPEQLINHCFSSLVRQGLNGGNLVVVSLAAPVDTKTGIVIKLTNHRKVEHTNIPLGPELEKRLNEHYGRDDIRVIIINDGEAGGWAEFSPKGALKHLKPGEIGMAFIIGNGVGGRLYRKLEDGGLQPVDGGFEPGHALIPFGRLGVLRDYVDERVECGCGIIYDASVEGSEMCLEAVTSGPSMESTFRKFIAAMLMLKPVSYRDPLIQAIMERRDFPNTILSHRIARAFKNEDVSVLMAKGVNSSLINAMLRAQAELLAGQIEARQRGVDNLGSMAVALIGGIGTHWGPALTKYMTAYSQRLRIDGQRQAPAWDSTPRYYVGAIPSDQTNLWGDAYFAKYLIEAGQAA